MLANKPLIHTTHFNKPHILTTNLSTESRAALCPDKAREEAEKGEREERSPVFRSCISPAAWIFQNWGKRDKEKERKKRAGGTNPLPFIVNLVKYTFHTISFMLVQPAL